jgi:anti-anti-sigma factor
MTAFEREVIDDITVLTVNLGRATINEAQQFKEVIDEEIRAERKQIVIDLSACEFIDSTFIGVLVVTLKKLAASGGELRIIQPVSIAHSILEITNTLNIFNIHSSKSEAVENLLDVSAA